jgi:hypothetical protein
MGGCDDSLESVMISLESDQDGGHVVAAEAGHGVLGDEFVEQLLQDLPVV